MQPTSEVITPLVSERGHLLRVLGVTFGLAVIIGNSIGAGILRTPGEVATQLHHPSWFIGIWIAGGLYALLGAVSIAELGTMLPRSGGQYVFARHALGDYAGFVVGWSDWVSTCGSTAAISIVVGEYSEVLVPALAGNKKLIAVAVAFGFAILQWRGIRWGSGAQNLTSLLKALAFIALVTAFFALGGNQTPPETTAAPAPTLLPIMLALQAVIFTYDGWTGAIYFSEEVRDPGRDIPRSTFGGVLAVIAIYLLVNLALLYVLPIGQIAGKELAVGAAAQAIFGENGDRIIRGLTILSMFSAVNACQLMATRVLFAMSRDGLVTTRLAAVNSGGTPAPALLVSTVVALAFILSAGGAFDRVIAVVSFFFVASYALSFLSVFVLRRREPQRARPYRVWGYPWTTALALIGSVAFLGGAVLSDLANVTSPVGYLSTTSFYSLVLLGASYPAFHLLRRVARQAEGDR